MLSRVELRNWAPAVLSLSVLLGTAALVRLSWTAAAEDPAFFADPDQVAVVACPRWMPVALAEQVARELADMSRPAPLLDAEALSSWSGRLERLSPWIEGLVSVTPRFPGQVDLRLALARPLLALGDGELVAGDGRLLGPGPVTLSPAPLVLVGPDAESARVACAAAASELLPFRERLDQAELRVASVLHETGDSGSRVVFVTDGGVALEWGRSGAGNAFAAVDLPPADRVANLLEVAAGRPGLFGVDRVVLWKDRPEVRLRP